LPARVYECNKSEVEELKKVLSYDPYLDNSLIPPSSKADEKNMTPEQKAEAEQKAKEVEETRKKIAESPKGKIIFTRQEYSLREGASLGLKDDITYLYLNAPDDFLTGAEERFKTEFKTIKPASKEEQEKVIAAIKEEEEKANTGFGSIFGN
jgi:hypothetical protein